MIYENSMDDRQKLKPILGLEDRFGLEMKALRYAGAKLSETFQKYGFQEIETPLIERPFTWIGNDAIDKKRSFTDVLFNLIQYAEDGEDYKTLDTVSVELRPEGTLPVCRFLADKIVDGNAELPSKLFYVTPMFRNEEAKKYSDVKKLMFYQAGVEFMGPASPLADLEVCDIATRSVRDLGFNGKMTLRLSDIAIFEGLVDSIREYGQTKGLFSDEKSVKKMKKSMKEAIDDISKYRAQKNLAMEIAARENLNAVLSQYPLTTEMRQGIDIITNSIGSRMELASNLNVLGNFNNARMQEGVRSLVNLTELFDDFGLEYTLDPAVVRGLSIYSGPVFQVDVELSNGRVLEEVAGGGRYDKCVGEFFETVGLKKVDIPATGFAYGLDRIVKAMVETRSLPQKATVGYNLSENAADVMVYSSNPMNALKEARRLRMQGQSVEVDLMGRSKQELEAYTAKKGIKLLEI